MTLLWKISIMKKKLIFWISVFVLALSVGLILYFLKIKPIAEAESVFIIESEIIPSSDGTFGYIVSIDGNPYIVQKNIPGIQGNTGFKSEKDAMKVSELVIEKIKRGELPPTVSIKELEMLKINLSPESATRATRVKDRDK